MKSCSLFIIFVALTWHCHGRNLRPNDLQRQPQNLNSPENNFNSNKFTAAWWDQFWSNFQAPSFSRIPSGFPLPAILYSQYFQDSSLRIPVDGESGYNLTIMSEASVGEGQNRSKLLTETVTIGVGPRSQVRNARRIVKLPDGTQREQSMVVPIKELPSLATPITSAPVEDPPLSNRATTQAPAVQHVQSELEREYMREMEIRRQQAQSEFSSSSSYGSSSSASSRASSSSNGTGSYSARVQNSVYGAEIQGGVRTVERHSSGSWPEGGARYNQDIILPAGRSSAQSSASLG